MFYESNTIAGVEAQPTLAGVEKVGNSSFVVIQEAWQNDLLVAKGKAVQVYFDFKTQKSDRIPDEFRAKLEALIL